MHLKDKKIGIWGWGVAGRSVGNYCAQHGAQVTVFEKRELAFDEREALEASRIAYIKESSIEQFIEQQEFVFPSPGIDLRPYQQFEHKWLNELDLFCAAWKKPIIAITGTVGKTSTTELLTQILRGQDLKVAVGGNIGVGLLDLLPDQETADYAVLELSSYQLERSLHCAPDVAILTNMYPNHLDRHSSFEEYRDAKYRLFGKQKAGQIALLPLEQQERFYSSEREQQVLFFSPERPTEQEIKRLRNNNCIYFFDNQAVARTQNGITKTVVSATHIPDISYKANWLMLIALLDSLGTEQHEIKELLAASYTIPQHRGELVAIKKQVEYYNDSKSTVFESTLASVKRLADKPLFLLLGGVSKGIDRTPLLGLLKPYIAELICFGAEAEYLAQAAKKHGIFSASYDTLQEAFQHATRRSLPGSRVLLSPAGASFDRFKSYQDRGTAFVKLVTDIKDE